MASAFFDVQNLLLTFRTRQGIVRAVDHIGFSLQASRSMVIIGESGCGKSSLSRAILRLLPRNTGEYSGQVWLDGTDVMQLTDEQFRRRIRWIRMALVPQAAMNSLNPVIRVEDQVAEPLIIHGLAKDRSEAVQKSSDVFELVGVPLDFLRRYPFELSGGMRQRAAIAMALATNPSLVVLDEPTSALDVLTQASIMNVLKRIKKEMSITFILITHDIAISSELADEVGVMYAGQLVERADAEVFYQNPAHPYSQRLMASVPKLRGNGELAFIPGQPPSLLSPPKGCRFAERCSERFAKCGEEPPLYTLKDGRQVKCWLYAEQGGASHG